ncbi:hypothetical protein EAE32_00310 [Kocuria tytonicola]|uniref:Uncharacterized protein n=1 Tax=Kocuria tytonicola TaxID=2055946 RepID=A0A3L9L727_9MICC|nr:hypothetical protein [Kocuria tytonicola]RLY93739.1 hypothetical protein EAE32_00310 [Kocuria tytonicola]
MTTSGTVHDDAADHDAVFPGPRGTVLRALPACVLEFGGTPFLAWFVPREAGRDWWALGIIVTALAVMFGAATLGSRGLPRADPHVDQTRWQRALASARHHGSLPSEPAVQVTAARVSYDRIAAGMTFLFLWAGIACGALVRPDLNWVSPLGGLIAISVIAWARVPSAWAYLRLHAVSV